MRRYGVVRTGLAGLAFMAAACEEAAAPDEAAPSSGAAANGAPSAAPMPVIEETPVTKPMRARAFADLPPAPVAEKRPRLFAAHGDEREDSYHWMRDDNWREILRDPSILRTDVRAHLEAENAYTDAAMADTAALQETLYQEMRGRIKEDDGSVPAPDGPWAYYVRHREGGQYPIYARRPRDKAGDPEAETIVLDGDAMAQGHDFFRIGGVAPAPDHKSVVYGVDVQGSEYFTLKVLDLTTGDHRADEIPSTDGAGVWSNDGLSFFYIERDDHQRPKRVKRHVVGAPVAEDEVVYDEPNDGHFLSLEKTSSDKFIVISSGDHETSKAFVIDADRPDKGLRLVAEEETGVRYSLDHRGGRFFILTDDAGAIDFKLMSVAEDAEGKAAWEEVVPHRPGVTILAQRTFRDFHVRLERENALPRIVVRTYEGEEHAIAFEEAAYALGLGQNLEFSTDLLRFTYESPTRPQETYDYDMRARTRRLLKTQEVPSGHDPDAYVVERIMATGHDGVEIPVTILRRAETPVDGTAPLYLYGYGSYGVTIPANFSIRRLSLTDRGVVTATAHVRGGAAKGQGWYQDGKLAKKPNTFKDFIAAADALVDRGYAAPGRIAAHGGSAGGLLMGAVANMAPEKFAAIVGEVPFVDVTTTISDASLPLTPPEWPEWGNPIEDEEAYRTILAYSPYDQVAARDYPPILATGGLSDYRVTYWEPAKWIARLRERAPEAGPYFLKMNMEAGHAGASGRFDALKEDALAYAFILKALGVEEL